MIVYLDLDRTLFRTENTLDIWFEVSQLYPEVDAPREYNSRDDFLHHVGDLSYHDFSAQLRTLEIDPVAAYEQLIETDLANGRFEFPGVRELVESLKSHGADVRILTFGQDDFQRFKVALCPSLVDLPVVTTMRPKHEYLEATEEECWVVDDKAIGDELPSSATFVQVSLEGEVIEDDAEWPVFYNLFDVKEFFDDVFDESE